MRNMNSNELLDRAYKEAGIANYNIGQVLSDIGEVAAQCIRHPWKTSLYVGTLVAILQTACSPIGTAETPDEGVSTPQATLVASETETAIPDEREQAPQASVENMSSERLSEVKNKIKTNGFLMGYANDTVGPVNLEDNKLEVQGGMKIVGESGVQVGELIVISGPHGIDLATSVTGDWETGGITRQLPDKILQNGHTIRSWGYIQTLDAEGSFPVSNGPNTRGLPVWIEEYDENGKFVGNWFLNPTDKQGTVYAVSLPDGKQVSSIKELAGLSYLKGLDIIANSDDPNAKGWEWVDTGEGEEKVIKVTENGIPVIYHWNEEINAYQSQLNIPEGIDPIAWATLPEKMQAALNAEGVSGFDSARGYWDSAVGNDWAENIETHVWQEVETASIPLSKDGKVVDTLILPAFYHDRASTNPERDAIVSAMSYVEKVAKWHNESEGPFTSVVDKWLFGQELQTFVKEKLVYIPGYQHVSAGRAPAAPNYFAVRIDVMPSGMTTRTLLSFELEDGTSQTIMIQADPGEVFEVAKGLSY